MAGRFARICALALALAAGGEASAARIVDLASARQAISSPAIIARDASFAALGADGRATELAARLELVARDATLSDVAQEWLLDRGLHALARIAPTSAARASVARLAARKPVVYTRADPDHGDRGTPLYDAGATARFVLRSWDRSAARAEAQAELAARSARTVLRFAGEASDSRRAGMADAFRA
ncbi:MAG TPA: hypothetical protein VFU77_02385, partial [Steroidobacteraceae bacterium]|nr:hypothetical protein [Steroidobacteraceae bacterium]